MEPLVPGVRELTEQADGGLLAGLNGVEAGPKPDGEGD